MILSLPSRGEHIGEFVICDGDKSYPIGDYIKVTLTSQPYDTGERVLVEEKIFPVLEFPLTIQFSRELEPFECVLRRVPGRITRHWNECLEVGKIQTIRAIKRSIREFTYWIPEIDGYRPGIFGKVKK